MGWKMREPTEPVAFRLPKRYRDKLAKEGAPYGLSLHEYARRIVMEVLDDEKHMRLLTEFIEVREALARLDGNLKVGVVALLADAGKAEVGEAKEWAKRNLC